MLNPRSLIYFFLFFFATPLFAIESDSISNQKIYKSVIKYIHEKDFIGDRYNYFYLDSSLSKIHCVNQALDNHHNYLGTNGSASEPQFFKFNSSVYSFTSIRSYDLQLMFIDSMKYYQTNKRLTELNYHNGNFKEQKISVIHTQNINRNWNAGLNFDRQGTKDYMNFSNTFRSRFALFTWFRTPNKKYNLFATTIWNSIKNGVNGGLASDSLFDNTIVSNLGIKGLAYKISNATQSVRKRNFYLSQYYDFNKTKSDTVISPISIRLHHQITLERKSFTYSDVDPDSSFYSDFYYGFSTHDSLHSDEINNRVAIQLIGDTSAESRILRNLSVGFFAEYQYMKYGQRSDSTWTNLTTGVNLILKSDSTSPEISTQFQIVPTGMDDGNYKFYINAFTREYSLGRIGINYSLEQSSPDLIFRWYDSNNFKWKNDFDRITNMHFGLNYELKKYHFSISASYSSIDKYVYMNEAALPAQYEGKITINQLIFLKNFNWRHWHFDNILNFQNADKDGVIHLPSVITDQSFYFEKHYFKNALLAATGLSANYNSSYFANEFMPANAMFYLQNATKTGGYVRFDLFLNAQIKTARIFLRFENAADGLFKNSYYLTPHYPMPGRVLKFGVIWRFFDQ